MGHALMENRQPSPPSEKASACRNQAAQASTGDGTGNWIGKRREVRAPRPSGDIRNQSK